MHKALVFYHKEHTSSFNSGVKMSPCVLQPLIPAQDDTCVVHCSDENLAEEGRRA
jgi:hypothetical protein